MRIQKIQINNFKSIYDSLVIDFNEIKGFWKIEGAVGAGKTTIGEALLFGLFGTISGKTNPSLISWGRKHGLVEVWCTSKNHDLYIRRELNAYGQSPVYVEVDGQELIFTNKRDAQSQLESEYYDISRTTLELLCIISFNNFKSLATLNSRDSRLFLDQVLGFYTLTEYADIAKTMADENQKKICNAQQSISVLDIQINNINAILQQSVETIQDDPKALQEMITELTTRIAKLYKDWKAEDGQLEISSRDLISKRAAIETRGKSLAREIKYLQNGICPTCGAHIDQSHLPAKQSEREGLLEDYRKLTQTIQEIADQRSAKTKACELLREELVNTQKDCQIRLTKIKQQQERAQYDSNKLIELQKERQQISDDLNDLILEDNKWNTLIGLLTNDVRIKILNTFIPSLNNNIQRYAQRLQLPYIVQFDQSFKCQITLPSMPDMDVPVSSLSTGQLKTVDMVVILGVLGTILGNNGLNVIFLDELFSNLDHNLRKIMCELLREHMDANTSMFIISHTDLDDQWFDGSIYVKLDNTTPSEFHTKIEIEHLNR